MPEYRATFQIFGPTVATEVILGCAEDAQALEMCRDLAANGVPEAEWSVWEFNEKPVRLIRLERLVKTEVELPGVISEQVTYRDEPE